MALVKKFFCCSLQKGGIAFGWVGVVLSVLHVLASFRVLGGYSESIREYPYLKYSIENSFATQFVSGVVFLIAFMLLVIGSKRGNRYMLLPWLIMGVGCMIGMAIIVFILAPIIMASGHGAAGFGGALFAIGLVGFALQLYLFLCVLALFQELREQDRQKDIPLPTVVHHVVTHTFAPTATTNHTTSYAPGSTTYPAPFPPSYDASDANASKV